LGEEKDKKFHIAKKVFEEVLEGKYAVVLSHFVLSEVLHALRNIATKETFKQMKNNPNQQDLIRIANSSEFKKNVNDKSLEAFKTIIEYITSNSDQFIIKQPHTPYSEAIFSEGLKILSRNFGVFRVYRYRCGKCDHDLSCDKCGFNCEIVYKSINAPDITHALISDNLKCEYFFTMDHYFDEIPKEEFKTKIIVLK